MKKIAMREVKTSKTSKIELDKIFQNAGLFLLGVASLSLPGNAFEFFSAWMKDGKHAEMNFLKKFADIRQDPHMLASECDRALVFAQFYNVETLERAAAPQQASLSEGTLVERREQAHISEETREQATQQQANLPKIARYAQLRDYHRVIPQKMVSLIDVLKECEEAQNLDVHTRLCVDTAPLLEKPLASTLRDCFVGKNTLLIHKDLGSFFVIGFLLTNIAFEFSPLSLVDPSVRSQDHGGCGTCKRCQVYCPTGALDKDYEIDARKCLAYYTIEHRGLVPLEFWRHFKEYFFGCDLCQSVCPYNKKSKQDPNSPLQMFNKTNSGNSLLKIAQLPPLFDIATMNQEFYVKHFAGTPMTRAKKTGLQRNALIAMCVREDPRLREAMEVLQNHGEEMIQGTLMQIPEFQNGCV